MDTFLSCAVAGTMYWSMHLIAGVPTVYYGDNENPKGLSSRTFESRAQMRQWVNITVASERMNKKARR